MYVYIYIYMFDYNMYTHVTLINKINQYIMSTNPRLNCRYTKIHLKTDRTLLCGYIFDLVTSNMHR